MELPEFPLGLAASITVQSAVAEAAEASFSNRNYQAAIRRYRLQAEFLHTRMPRLEMAALGEPGSMGPYKI
jgi:hypothetical protein